MALGSACRRVGATTGFPFDAAAFNREGRGTRLIRIRDLLPGSEPTYVDAVIPQAVVVQPGDIVVGMDGEFNVVRWAGPPAALNQRLCRLTPTSALDPAYLAYVLPFPLRFINDLTFYTTVKHLSTNDLLAQRIPVPPREDQLRIVRELDVLRDQSRATRSRLAHQIRLLREHRQALITAAVTGELDVVRAAA